MSKKILIVDDEKDILELLDYHLIKEGYKTMKASNGKEALKVAKDFLPDLVLLDLMMPEMDGIETCLEFRENKILKDCLIAILTARAEDYSQIAGLNAGADDYINKPIKPRVLLSRIKALLRRTESKVKNDSNVELEIDTEKYVAILKGEEMLLPKKEFELLALLFSKPGKVFTREVILARVWGDDIIVGDRTIDVHIRKLREKLGNQYIKTVKGVGYKLKL
ncbi:MAG: response regulator transcription factor [Parvicellaceae bacterium]